MPSTKYARYKKFNGKRYELEAHKSTKREGQNLKQTLRLHWKYARVIKAPDKGWLVYSRNK